MIAESTYLNRVVRTLAHPKRYKLWPGELVEFDAVTMPDDTIEIRVQRWVGELTRDNPTYRWAVVEMPKDAWRRYQNTGIAGVLIEVVNEQLDKLFVMVRTLPVPFRLHRKGKRYLQTNEQIWHETKEVPGRRENYWSLFRQDQDQRRAGRSRRP